MNLMQKLHIKKHTKLFKIKKKEYYPSNARKLTFINIFPMIF